MGRSVVADEALEAAADAVIAAGRAVEAGLLIGRLATEGVSRDLILGLVPTPVKEDGTDAAGLVTSGVKPRSGSASAGNSLSFDVEWVAEHARQVSRMLVGGIGVAGIYCMCPDNVFKQSTSILSQVMKAVVAAISDMRTSKEHLIFHIATSPRRIACRSCSWEPNGSFSLKPCEWKSAKVAANLQSFGCSYVLDVSIPIPLTPEPDTYKNKLLSWTASEIKQIQSAEVLVDDLMVNKEEVLSTTTTDKVRDVQLLLPLERTSTDVFENPKNVTGTITLKGTIYARAYGYHREPISHAIACIKEDIVASLRNRIDLLCEEGEQMTELPKEAASSLLSVCGEQRAGFTCILPRRVLIPWKGIYICDYLLPTESMKDTQERCNELLAFPADLQTILEPEEFFKPPPPEETKSKSRTQTLSDSKSSSSVVLLVTALLAVLVALTFALLSK